MYKKKSFFITFEGIEGSGKSYQSNKLFNNIKKMNLSVHHTREPGGTFNAERIRKIILKDYFGKKRSENCKIVKRKGRVYVINKKNPRYKQRQG